MILAGPRRFAAVLFACGFILSHVGEADSETQTPARSVLVIRIDDYVINPIVAEYVHQALQRAEAERKECLVIELDTPGGLVISTRKIVKEIVNAKVPTIVYISPSGSRAGSAGVFITLASHLAAMAPSTNIGAAHPVSVSGTRRTIGDALYELVRYLRERLDGGKKKKEPVEEKEPELVMSEKVIQDTVAWVRAIANERGRNAEWAERAVRESVSQTEKEAVSLKIVELVAGDLEELLALADGRKVSLASGEKVLRTKGALTEVFEMTARQKFLNTISHPTIAYILMLLGFYGLLYEITNPGIGFPGIAGAICLILAFYAFQTLPVNYAGIALIILGILLFIAELKVASYGLLTLGGLVCMILGSLMMIESPYEFMRISTMVIFPFVLATAAITLFLVGAVIRAQRRKTVTGTEGLVGEVGVAETAIHFQGKVFVHGEIWNAVSSEPIVKGEPVEILAVEHMKLRVRKK